MPGSYSLLLVLADTVGRSILTPRELPSGLVAALFGAPYFMWLMYCAGKQKQSIRLRNES
ncbi:iron chelate uptake ABC transporter family permease subunit [Paenibacillus sp. NEAU-GSW1]|uniref:iron chelate uptake ABC transporter family permease subunit n=1 Tax=Paenibacillus sp. NEAU-GSW1 TaxID=2682486 RepID=UPI0020A6BD5B|nr:iron chelate uptake ABC transporter family permease subunit [Paenibacillus sp. NEAU-GSW1]